MALSTQEQALIEFGVKNGKSKAEVEQALVNFRSGVAPKQQEATPGVSDIRDDVVQTIKRPLAEVGTGIAEVANTALDENLNPFQKILQGGAQAFRHGARAFGELVIGAGKTALPQRAEDVISEGVKSAGEEIAQQPAVQDLISRYQALDPDKKRNVDNALGYAEGLGTILTGGVAKKVIGDTVDAATRAALGGARALRARSEKFLGEAERLFPTQQKFGSVDELISAADRATRGESAAMAIAEGAVKVNPIERMAGLSPDIKRRIQGKQDQMREYIDVTRARNIDDTKPTVYEFGSQRTQDAVDSMETLLNKTGSEIGETRQRLTNYQAPITAMANIEKVFFDQLDKLNLRVVNGVVSKKPGTVSRTAAANDVKALQELYSEFLTVKEGPSLKNLIDYRTLVDQKINFGREAREVSNSIDPLSRQLRNAIKVEAERIVGKQEAKKLADYSEFMDAYTDLRSYTERRAGGEYLLRLVLSGRGGEARRLIDAIKKHTGIDLQDDATMMTLSADMFGNTAQKNLFRQEVTKAGFDAAQAITGDPRGIISFLSRVADFDSVYSKAAEKVILKAAE